MKSEAMIRHLDDLEWQTLDVQPGLRWKFLIDANHTPTHGFTLGTFEIDPGAQLSPHRHGPQEVYFIHQGRGRVWLGGERRDVGSGSVVYIPENCTHGIENIGDEVLGLYWLFPTDTWAEIEYIFEPE